MILVLVENFMIFDFVKRKYKSWISRKERFGCLNFVFEVLGFFILKLIFKI